MSLYRSTLLMAAASSVLLSQPTSSYRYTVQDGQKVVEITNVTYELTSSSHDLVLRTTTHLKQVLEDIGVEASTTVEAWKLGVDLKQKPLYAVTVAGTESRTVDGEVFVVSRGLEEVEWWSVYRLATGVHMFDTYLPLVKFSASRESVSNRYVGLQVPEDDIKDKRLKEPHVVAVVSYASEAKLIREALITCDDPKQAVLLRSLADTSRTLAGTGEKSPSLRVSFSQNFPSPANTMAVVIPISGDDLDIAHAQLPPHLHVVAWKR